MNFIGNADAFCRHRDRGNRWLLPAIPVAEERQVCLATTACCRKLVFVCMAVVSASNGHWTEFMQLYGGVYITVAICWLWIVDGVRPSRWDIVGVIDLSDGNVQSSCWQPRT